MGVDLVDITGKRAELSPERVAFVDAASGARLSYRTLDNRARRCARALLDIGVGEGDRVAVLCRNRIEFFELMFGCAKIGAILVPLNWRMPPTELAPLIADCAPKALFYGRGDAGAALMLARPDIVSIGFDEEYESYIACAAPLEGMRVWRGEDAWCLLYTSGTTGEPKAVIQTYQMALVNHMNATLAFGVRPGDRTLNFLPLFHTAGIHLLTLPTLISGGTATVLPGFDAARVLAALANREVDVFFGVPAIYRELAMLPEFAHADLSAVRAWACGGAPLSDALAHDFAQKGVAVCTGYGMTETGPTAFASTVEEARTKIGSVGRPQMLLEARIVDAHGRDVADDEIGEIWMRGPGVTPGYWRRPEITAQSFSDGWLKSGDLGRRDADGSYYVVGRLKEMYISGGENVYPAEVENALARHPAVLEAAVVGVADERWGEVGHAFVQLRDDAPSLDASALIHFCRRQVAAYKAPRFVTFVAELPRTPAGKVSKHLLLANRLTSAA